VFVFVPNAPNDLGRPLTDLLMSTIMCGAFYSHFVLVFLVYLILLLFISLGSVLVLSAKPFVMYNVLNCHAACGRLGAATVAAA